MVYLHEDAASFDELVARAAQRYDLLVEYVAKDYFIFMLLREIARKNPAVVFKGGTSLSKGHGVINRFSEDIDLGMRVERPTEGMRKAMKACVVDAVADLGLAVANLEDTRSRREFNRFVVPLPHNGASAHKASQSSQLLVETALMTPAAPASMKAIDAFIYRYLHEEGLDDVAEAYELNPFSVGTASMERTFCDKVFALCDYYLGGGSLERQSRHMYDLHKLWTAIPSRDALLSLMPVVKGQREGKHGCLSANPDVRVATVLEELLASDAYRHDYESVTALLLYEDVPYGEAAASMRQIAAFLSAAE